MRHMLVTLLPVLSIYSSGVFGTSYYIDAVYHCAVETCKEASIVALHT